MESVFRAWSYTHGRLNFFRPHEGKTLLPGTVHNHQGQLVWLHERVPKSKIDADILAHEIQYRRQHMVIAYAAPGPLLSDELAIW